MAYTFSNGIWGNYNDKASSATEFTKLRQRLGFTESKEFSYALGTATLYSREDKTVKWDYSFVCRLSVNRSSSYHIWIKDLPSVFQFLREIGAQKSEHSENHVQDLIDYLENSFFNEALNAIYRKLNEHDRPGGAK